MLRRNMMACVIFSCLINADWFAVSGNYVPESKTIGNFPHII